MVSNLWEWYRMVICNSLLRTLLIKKARKSNICNKKKEYKWPHQSLFSQLVLVNTPFLTHKSERPTSTLPKRNHHDDSTTHPKQSHQTIKWLTLLGNAAAKGHPSQPNQNCWCSWPSFRGRPPNPAVTVSYFEADVLTQIFHAIWSTTSSAAPKMTTRHSPHHQYCRNNTADVAAVIAPSPSHLFHHQQPPAAQDPFIVRNANLLPCGCWCYEQPHSHDKHTKLSTLLYIRPPYTSWIYNRPTIFMSWCRRGKFGRGEFFSP